MLRSRIIPSLLVDDGDLIKSENFSNDKYIGDPINAVKIFNEKSVDELAIFDVGVTLNNSDIDMSLLFDIAKAAKMPLCYGGGVHESAQATELVKSGFEKVSVSSGAIYNPNLLDDMARCIGAQSVVLCLDIARNNSLPCKYSVFTHRGTKNAELDLLSALEMAAQARIGELIINSIDRDGTMAGYDLELVKSVLPNISCPVTFVGGAGTVAHMNQLISVAGTVGAAAGSMFVYKGINRAVLLSYAKP